MEGNKKAKDDEEFRQCMASMRSNEIFCDTVLRIPGEDTKFPVHRVVMASCSAFFRSLFLCGLKEATQGEIAINGLNKRTMEILIQYAYTSRVSLSAENIEDVFIAADRFGLLGLLAECVCFLTHHLSPDNCIGFLRFARFHNNAELSNICWKFITRNFTDITRKSQEFMQLGIDEMIEVVKDDKLNVIRENDVYNAIMKWTEFYPRQRRQHLKVLLQNVRFPFMSEDFFCKNIIQKRDLKRSPYWENIQMSYSVVKRLRSASDPVVRSTLADWLRPRVPCKVIFVLGGWGQNGVTESIETYDKNTDKWFEVRQCDLPTPRAYHGTVTVEDKIYAIGGFNGINYLNSVIRFDVIRKKWEELNPMHMMRCYVSVTEMDSEIYVCGGYDGRQRHNSAEKYSISRNQWTVIKPMFIRRSDAGAITCKGKLYVAGGFNGHACLMSAECYNPHTNQWTVIAPMSDRRSGVSLAVWDDQIYAIGGFDGSQRLHSVEQYDPRRGHWYQSPSMNLGRSNFCCVVMDDIIYVMGGYDGEKTSSKVECYCPEKEKWTELGDLNLGRSAVSACVVSDVDNAEEYIRSSDDGSLHGF